MTATARAALALCVVPLLAAGDCDPTPNPTPTVTAWPAGVAPEPTLPPEPAGIDTVAIVAYVDEPYCPYTVTSRARDLNTGEVKVQDDPVASGNYTKILTFPKGHRVTVEVTLRASRAGSLMGYLWVKHSATNKKQVSLQRRGSVTTSLTTDNT